MEQLLGGVGRVVYDDETEQFLDDYGEPEYIYSPRLAPEKLERFCEENIHHYQNFHTNNMRKIIRGERVPMPSFWLHPFQAVVAVILGHKNLYAVIELTGDEAAIKMVEDDIKGTVWVAPSFIDMNAPGLYLIEADINIASDPEQPEYKNIRQKTINYKPI